MDPRVALVKIFFSHFCFWLIKVTGGFEHKRIENWNPCWPFPETNWFQSHSEACLIMSWRFWLQETSITEWLSGLNMITQSKIVLVLALKAGFLTLKNINHFTSNNIWGKSECDTVWHYFHNTQKGHTLSESRKHYCIWWSVSHKVGWAKKSHPAMPLKKWVCQLFPTQNLANFWDLFQKS